MSDAAERLPLTARQSLFWLDAQLFPDARYHNVVACVEILGPLDGGRLSLAWAQTIADLDVLRLQADTSSATVFERRGPPPDLETVELDASAFPAWCAARAATSLRQRWGLWDAVLVRTGPERHVLYLCVDHLIFDGSSLVILLENVEARYLGREIAPAPSFRDYVASEFAYRASPRASDDQAYWARKLSSGPPPVRLYGIPRTDRSAALARAWAVPDEARGLALSSAAALEPFRTISAPLSRLVVMATALAASVYRVSGNREVLIGVPWANRSPRFARTCGLLMEQLFLRIEVEEGDTFAALGRRVRQEILHSLRHASACISDRGAEYVTLNLLPSMPTRFAGLAARVDLSPATVLAGEGSGSGDFRDSLGLLVSDLGTAPLRLALDFSAATFTPTVRSRFQDHLLRILDGLVADPSTPIDSVQLLGEAERETVLRASVGPWPEPAAPDLLQQVRVQVHRRPDHVAVEAPDGNLTYAQLEATSDRLARRLRSLGVIRESRVGVAVPRGARELCALLATLKAGGAYVPVDPGHPVERVRVILEDAAPDVLVAPSDSPLRDAMPPGTKLLALDDLATAVAGFDEGSLDEPADPDQLAYILFTSGSTGRPKGVEVLRGGFANFLRSMAREPGLREDDRFLAITTTTFDISGLELFGPLWVGATTVIVDRQTSMDPRLLGDVLARGRFTVLQATPATWRMLVDSGWRGTRGLRMLCGGEPLSRDLADRLLERGSELWNVYGPTETTVWSTLDRVLPGDARITIGRPIDRTRVYVLDPSLRLVPPGVVGEIFIGGDGVARGYRGRPDLTAERFLPDPFGPAGFRFYRTGDLGRLLDDGRFECLGRTDHQVKVRGFRIELGEIESALRSVPGVREVVVVAERQGAGDPRLVAYWVGEAERAALYERARNALAPYMVPSAFARLQAFPLTTSGKVDRKALPSPDEVASSDSAPLLRPRNDTEARVAAIWADVLGLGAVGIDQDFFALGGTSLLAIRARSRLEEEFDVAVPLRAFFESPTVSAIAEWVSGQSNSSPASHIEPIVLRLRKGRDDLPPMFCLFGIQLYQEIAEAFTAPRTVIGVHVPIFFRKGEASRISISDVGSRYVEIIRKHQPVGPYQLIGFCFGGVVAYEVARQLIDAGERVTLVGVLDGRLSGGKQLDRRVQLASYLRKAAGQPLAAIGKAGEFLARRLFPSRRMPAGGEPDRDELVELDVNADYLLRAGLHWEAGLRVLPTHVLVFRADRRIRQPWERYSLDLGWSSHADRVTAIGVDCDHLEMALGKNAEIVARALASALGDST